MSVCTNCKEKKHCQSLPGICLKLPYILTGAIAVLVAVLMFNSTL